jgi:hypothetical protein
MASYIVKKKQKIERQKNDHFDVVMIVDADLPFSSTFTFGIYTKQGKQLVVKDNPTKDAGLRKLTFTFVPSDTATILNNNLVWELEMKTTSNNYYTVGAGDFILIPTNVINE